MSTREERPPFDDFFDGDSSSANRALRKKNVGGKTRPPQARSPPAASQRHRRARARDNWTAPAA
ncbi:MAG TPA: hypothetical protein VF845_12380, partial [Terriglobales bacterium]